MASGSKDSFLGSDGSGKRLRIPALDQDMSPGERDPEILGEGEDGWSE